MWTLSNLIKKVADTLCGLYHLTQKDMLIAEFNGILHISSANLGNRYGPVRPSV